MAGNKNQLAGFRTGLGPFEIVLYLHRLVVFVNSYQGHVDIESGKVEVVRVATKKRGLKFRHKNQTNICKFFISIEVVLPTLIKRNNIAAEASRLRRFGLNGVDLSASGGVGFDGRHTALDSAVNAIGHIIKTHEHVQADSRSL